MAPVTTSSGDIELVNGTTVLPLMFARPLADDGITPIAQGPLTFEEALVAARGDTPVAEWLETAILRDFSGGFGVDYSAAPGLDTYSTPGRAFPAGAATNFPVHPTQDSASPIWAFADYGGDLWVAQRGTGVAFSARVMRSASGTGALANSLNLGANEYLFDLAVADNGSGTKVLWASSSDVNGASGRMHKWDGATWTSTAAGTFGTNGRNRMKVVSWRDEFGITAVRIFVVSSNQGHVSYTKPNADPMLAASWVEGVRTGTTRPQPELAAARGHVWIAAESLFDMDELGNSPDLRGYTENHAGSGAAALYHDGYVYYSAGASLDRIRVETDGTLQEEPGTCSPGYRTRSKSPWAVGYTTALAAFQGYVLAAQYCPGNGRPAIFVGKDRRSVQAEDGAPVDTANPLVWHGPYAHGSEEAVVTRMWVTSVTPTVSRLYVATWNTNQVSAPRLAWISLSALGGAGAGLVAGSGHRFATGSTGSGTIWNDYCRLETLPDDGGSMASTKDLYQVIYGSEGLPASGPSGTDPSFTVYTRADPTPSSTSWGTGQNVTTGPTRTITPATTRGQKIEHRIDFLSPNGTATPPLPAILDSLESLFWRTSPDLDTWSVSVEFGPGIVMIDGTPWAEQGRDVAYFTDALLEMTRAGRITLRDRQDRRWSVKVKQVLDRTVAVVDHAYGEVKRATLVIAKLGAAA